MPYDKFSRVSQLFSELLARPILFFVREQAPVSYIPIHIIDRGVYYHLKNVDVITY